MTEKYISIGKIVGSFGLKGLLKILHSGGILSESATDLEFVFLKQSNHFVSKKITVHGTKGNLIIALLEGTDTVEGAEKLVGREVYLPESELQKFRNPGEFFLFELVGCTPYENGNVISGYTLTDVLDNPAHMILVFENSGKEILIPYIDKFVGRIDTENRKIEIIGWNDFLNAD
ncbi:MAG TPA: ribosome maturation factor RimM [Leptospiraceae bacterium]|nr:ribosome maturation factor RimM [Leptospiraceae bacterium]HMY69146.1 ribosome maturation factor RimM [Leptospiraceae bacterium]HMZ57544.1 ribosome maturation factor RimM [Leptospiraceae bacterium]HNF15191.1 ribosome maturation factor RimM [Leptospiraceae bacterium]HNF27065.1 ribosome maturation factor RimM [Leptospiraceae bacterium]